VAGKTPLNVPQDRRRGLERPSGSANRPEAGRARAILLSLAGWTSAPGSAKLSGGGSFASKGSGGFARTPVRDWRSVFMREGLVGIERHPAPGCPPVKAQAALSVAGELFAAPAADRANWTMPRLCDEIERRTGHSSSCNS